MREGGREGEREGGIGREGGREREGGSGGRERGGESRTMSEIRQRACDKKAKRWRGCEGRGENKGKIPTHVTRPVSHTQDHKHKKGRSSTQT